MRFLLALLLALPVLGAKAPAKTPPKPKAPPLTSDQRAAQSLMKSMTLRDKVAQLIIVVTNGDALSTKSPDYTRFKRLVSELHIGGLIVNNAVQYGLVRNAEPHALATFLNQMQKFAKVPLIVSSDFERAASMRVTGGTRFPHNMAFGAANDLDATRYEGLIAAREARALGIQWIFAPDADVNNNPANPIINIRSYGEDPDQVSKHVAAFIEGAHADPANRILVTAKHFPGHGDTDVDSHLGLPRLNAPRDRLDSIELKPFQTAIAKGVDSIMTAHMSVPALDATGVPATVSPSVLTDLLRDDLKFPGLIVTDAMNMQGLAQLFDSGEGSVRALIAGADVLLMPSDPDRAVKAVIGAVEDGRLSRARIEQSVMRVLTAKVALGLTKKKLVDLDAISDVLDSPEAAQRAQQLADRAVTVIRNQSNTLPLAPNSRACLIVVTERRISRLGQSMIQEFQKRAPMGKTMAVDTSMPLAALDAMVPPGACDSYTVGSFAGVSANLGDVTPFLTNLAAGSRPVVLVAFENPYLLTSVPNVPAFMTTFSSAAPSEVSAVKALFGEVEVDGRTPVTIPGFARIGDGVSLPKIGR